MKCLIFNMLISHRGNIIGPDPRENSPQLILRTLQDGYFVEIDLWFDRENKTLNLGHDYPQYNIDSEFLSNPKIICHAKNLDALEYCLNSNIHCFWHQEDDYTITSNGYIWAYPGKPVSNKYKTIIVDNNKPSFKYDCIGICSDYVQLYKAHNI